MTGDVTPAEQEFYSRTGKTVQQRRRKLGWTQSRLGSQLDPPLVKASIAQIERGRQRIAAFTLIQLTRVLDLPLAVLFDVGAGEKVEAPPGSQVRSVLAKELVAKDVKELVDLITTVHGVWNLKADAKSGGKP